MIAPRDCWSCYFGDGNVVIWDGQDLDALAEVLDAHVASGELTEAMASDYLLDAYQWSHPGALHVSVPFLLSVFTIVMCFVLALFLRIILSWV